MASLDQDRLSRLAVLAPITPQPRLNARIYCRPELSVSTEVDGVVLPGGRHAVVFPQVQDERIAASSLRFSKAEVNHMNTLLLQPRPTTSRDRAMRHASHRAITDVDRRRLGTLIMAPLDQAWGTSHLLGKLEMLLEDAEYFAGEETPRTLVTMNTTMELEDVDSGARRLVTVVYPQDADDAPGAVSVLEPLGLAALGCRVGDVLQCPTVAGRGLRVAKIVYQPEQAEACRP
jgi:regulator of nucleoside diphosphate kinase